MWRIFLFAAVLICALSLVHAQDAAEEKSNSAAIDVEIKKLGDADFGTREAADKALFQIGKPAAAALRVAARGNNPEVASRARGLLARIFPPLVLSAEPEGEARVGQTVKFKIRIKNASDQELAAVRCLDGSTDGQRYPLFSQADSTLAERPRWTRFCGNCNSLGTDDFVKLKPGEEFDPFGKYGHGQGGFGAELCEFKPTAAGKITLTFTCDYSQTNLANWDGPIERQTQQLSKEDQVLYSLVPKIRMEAKVELDVKE